eukprot:TRINITY_DN1234_c0_g1_i2.p1 TRINITY_DN1234_c0_g1~~TRINITY_DN1234_c0_g1_i2.p1  ORF type:complete len:621 (+),score=88.80 TRINITY_DN1234_c0_g1_i2:369-2231(+)
MRYMDVVQEQNAQEEAEKGTEATGEKDEREGVIEGKDKDTAVAMDDADMDDVDGGGSDEESSTSYSSADGADDAATAPTGLAVDDKCQCTALPMETNKDPITVTLKKRSTYSYRGRATITVTKGHVIAHGFDMVSGDAPTPLESGPRMTSLPVTIVAEETSTFTLTEHELYPMCTLCQQSELWISPEHMSATERVVHDAARAGPVPLVTMVCGGKNSGKSTWVRYTVNRLLKVSPRVVLVDTDLGQPELGPPGYLSAYMVSRPLTPCTFINQSFAEPMPGSCYLGAVSAKNDPKSYQTVMESILSSVLPLCTGTSQTSAIPIIINTHGWVQGVGRDLLLAIYRAARPSVVVEFYPRRHLDNPGDLANYFAYQSIEDEDDQDKEDRVNIVVDTFANVLNRRTQGQAVPPVSSLASAIDRRTLQTLSSLVRFPLYRARSVQALIEEGTRALACKRPYTVPISSLVAIIHVPDISASQVLYALNGSIVDLVRIKREEGDSPSKGMGPLSFADYVYTRPSEHRLQPRSQSMALVRGIDTQAATLHIIPSHPQHLQHVNAVIIGSLETPTSILRAQPQRQMRTGPAASHTGPYVVGHSLATQSGAGALSTRTSILRKTAGPRNGV